MNYSTMKCIKLAAILSIAIGLSACSEQKTTEEYIAASKVYIQNLEYGAAIVELKSAVRQAPKDAEARLHLGKAYLKQGSYVNAEKELEKAVSLGHTENIIPSISFIKMKLNKPNEVFKLLDNGINLSGSEYLLLLVYAGVTSVQINDIEKGQDFFNQAISLNEADVYGQLSKAYLAQTKNDYQGALSTIDIILLNHPQLSEALLLKGNLQYGLGQYQKAADTFSLYIKQVPQDIHVKYFEVQSLIRAGNFEEAEVIADYFISKIKSTPLINQYKAEIEFHKKDYSKAKRFAEQAARAGNQFKLAKMIAGMSAYQLRDMEQAYLHLRPLEQYVSNNHPIKRILAVVKLELGYVDEALNDFNDLTDVDEVFLQLASKEVASKGDIPSALSLLIRAEQLSPNNAGIKVQKGTLLLNQGDESGITTLEQAIHLDPNLEEVKTTLALEYLKQGNDEKAKTIIDQKLTSDKTKVSGLLLRGVFFTKQKKYDEAKKSFDEILLIEPKNVAALYNLGLLANENLSVSVQYYQQVLLIQPSHQGAIQRLSQVQAGANKIDETVAFLTSLNQTEPNNLNIILGLAQNLRKKGDIKQAILLLNNVEQQTIKSAGYWVILGDSYTQNRDFEKANETFNKAVELFPSHFLINLRRIGMLEIENKHLEALQATHMAYKKFPDNTRLEMLLSYYELLNKNYEATEQRLAQLENKKISNPFIDNIAGQLALERKSYSVAVESFSDAYQKLPNSKNVISLARALKFNGQQNEAKLVLTDYINDNPKNTTIRMILASLYSSSEQHKSMEQYKAILKVQPENVVVLNNLAWSQYENNLNVQALVNIKKAHVKQPTSIQVLESYGVILIANNQYIEGVKVLKQAINKGSKDENVQIALAEAFVAKNDYKSAKLILNSLESKNEKVLTKREALINKMK